MMEDRKKVVERILTEIHHGNFHPVTPSSELSTPEQEELPLLPTQTAQQQITPKPQQSEMTTPSASNLKSVTLVGPSPERRKQLLELSHISIAGTPMINRPCSEHLDDDLFHFTPRYPWKGKVMTSSGKGKMLL